MGILDQILLASGVRSGLLSTEEKKSSGRDALLALGQGLLSASGPSLQPTSFGQALGSGIAGLRQSQQGSLQNVLAERNQQVSEMLAAAQLAKLNEKGAQERYANVTQDDLGRWWGVNKQTGQVEQIPIASDTGFTKFKTVEGTGATGLPEKQLVNPAAFPNQQIISIPGAPPPNFQFSTNEQGQKVLSPIPGGPAARQTTEEAGKAQMVLQGLQDIRDARSLVFDKNGKLNKGTLVGASVPFTAGVGGESRKLYSKVYNAISAKLRSETGAAAPEEEVREIARRFLPSVLDTEDSARDKMDRLEEFFKGTSRRTDPSGTFANTTPQPRPAGQATGVRRFNPATGRFE